MTEDDARKPEPPWIGKLSRIGRTAQAMLGKSTGTFGAASAGRKLMAWACESCAWSETSQELKAGADTGLACPMCGGAVKPA
jgi:hypothetical protein